MNRLTAHLHEKTVNSTVVVSTAASNTHTIYIFKEKLS